MVRRNRLAVFWLVSSASSLSPRFCVGSREIVLQKTEYLFSAQLRYLDWLFYSSDFNCLACRPYDDRLEFRNADEWSKLSREPRSLGNALRLGHALFVRSMVKRKNVEKQSPVVLGSRDSCYSSFFVWFG